MSFAVLFRRLVEKPEAEAIIERGIATSYQRLSEMAAYWRGELTDAGVEDGAVVELQADFSPLGVALLLALGSMRCIVAPRTLRHAREPEDASGQSAGQDEFLDVVQVEWVVAAQGSQASWRRRARNADHPLYQTLRARRAPGLVLFSSGSTGKSKATLHDLDRLCEKFLKPHTSLRTLAFLLFDHIGGVDVMFYTLSGHGCLVVPAERTPEGTARAIAEHRVQLFPTSPTFLNMMLLSGATDRHDFSHLETISFGAEPMPESLLMRCRDVFPKVKLVQTYGLSELGAMRTEARDRDSLWMKLKGNEFQYRVVEGVLQVKSRSAMLGYLNAPSPFTDDGWYITGDVVEVDGDFLRILGRASELINVGGQKVYPAEVENVIRQLPFVAEVSVHKAPHPITGQIVCAVITPRTDGPFDTKEAAKEVKRFCMERLESYKAPVKITFTDQAQHGDRLKKLRPRLEE